MLRKVVILLLFTLLILLLPIIGIRLTNQPSQSFFSFPPISAPSAHKPFSWPIFTFGLGLSSVFILTLGRYMHRASRNSAGTRTTPARTMPIWGWMALGIMLITWFFAWTRFYWFEPLQRHTFLPLWLSYIVLVNALCQRQTGRCPLFQETLFLLLLFPVSSIFWWYFEYLNQFVRNWYYTGVDYGPISYSVHASISFSTVLPAVYSTKVYIDGSDWFKHNFADMPALKAANSAKTAWFLLLLSCVGLAGIALWPEELFPLLWVAPLFLLLALHRLTGQEDIVSNLAVGNWRPLFSAALAALICGFFWEMWNYFSLAKWVYSIPYVQGFQIFEMPVLGYFGYLPFGLECIVFAELFRGIGDRKNGKHNTFPSR